MKNLSPAQEVQAAIEVSCSKKNIKKKILTMIDSSPAILVKIEEGVQAINEWRSKEYSYPAKNKRLEALSEINLEDFVKDVMTVVLPLTKPTLLTNVSGQLANHLGFENKRDGIITAAEILAVLSSADLFDLKKNQKYSSIYLHNRYKAPQSLLEFIHQTKYLPPMVCEPRILTKNSDSAHITVKDHIFLGKEGNYHNGNMCLDNLNRLNRIPFSLNVAMLTQFSETPKKLLKTKETKDNWEKMVRDSYEVYTDLVHKGNKFWIPNKPDTRGRTYSQGYHVSPQGNSFRKSIIQFNKKQLVEGV